ncbi:MAG: HAMP domain-containing protein [Gammaproteobacteria bacterium]|nr:HAMP domain-containing protein [Gammaproteobacteria bacterium]MDH5735835.1 HAMP domain-containing protein [Gammaproteobacteria bacterium]
MTNRLETRLLNYFLLIAMAAIMIGIEFFFEMQRDDLIYEICSISDQSSITDIKPTTENNTSPALTKLRNKIVIMFALLTIVVAIVMTMFIKNITMPLQKMADVAKSINEGDLSQVIEINNQDEIAMVGKAINELTSNLQECATFTYITANQTLEKINELDSKIKENTPLNNNEISEIKYSLESLIEFADSFQLLHTNVDNHA